MAFENRVKQLLAQGKAAFGASSGVESEFAAKVTIDTGVDFFWVDTEHSPYGVESVRMLPVLARMKGCVPMIRVAGLDSSLIKKALDAGASAIMIPQINNAGEARAAVSYSRYPPQGTRGVSPIWTFYLDIPWSEYLPEANNEILVVAQIESPEGIRNLESIAEVEGVDVLLAGPADLSASLGHIGNTEHPDVRKFLEEFPGRVARTGKTPGIALSSGEAAKLAYQQGYRFINIGSVLWSGVRGLAADLKILRDLE